MNVPPRYAFLQSVTEKNPGPGPGSSGAAPATLTGRRILVVDDNEDAADSLAMLLEYLGGTVRVANSGEAALEILEEYRPEVVLLDIGMPGMDGYAVARRVREQPQYAEARLIALSGWSQDEDKQRSSQSGFDYHLTKPVDLTTLESLLTGSGGNSGAN
jgi:CheY-like chemotaxis protein